MDEMTAFDQQIAREVVREAGPPEPVDGAAIFTAITATQAPKWRFPSVFSATRFVVAGAIVALFSGFMLAGMLTTQPSDERMPAVGAPTSAAALESYESTGRLSVNPGPDPTVQDLALAEAALVRYADLARSRPIAQAVIDELGLDEGPESLLGRISTEASSDQMVLSITARDDDPKVARELALAFGTELRQRVRDELITDEVRATDRAISTNEQNVKTLRNRLNALYKKSNKTAPDRAEIIALTSQISALQRDIQALRPSSRSYVRNLLDWFERPTVPEQAVQVEGSQAVEGEQGMDLSTRDVVVATQRIERGTALQPEMLTLRTVPLDATNEMALTDTASALGKVAAIDILVNQAISPNMLVPD